MTLSHDDLTVNGNAAESNHSGVSAALLKANRLLMERRTEQQLHDAPWADETVDAPDVNERIDPLDIANRQLQAKQEEAAGKHDQNRERYKGWFAPLKNGISNLNEQVNQEDEDDPIEVDARSERDVLLHPSIAVALLQSDQVAVGRLWLLARSLDEDGCGHIQLADLRDVFTDKDGESYVCGWRRLRMLLEQGEGVLWERDDHGRLWIYGVGHVAMQLELERVEGVAVHVNVADLLNIQSCRAHFYASWFSGRKTTNPISRAKLTELTGVSEEQQRLYEKVANVDVKSCLAIGERYSLEGMQEAGYQRGAMRGHGQGVVFEFIDYKGKQGKAGEKYIAWHLPNQYTGRHKRAGKSSRRNINRYLNRHAILEKKLTLGNGTSEDIDVVPVFFPNVKAATNRSRKQRRETTELYWEGVKSRTHSAKIWCVTPQEVNI